MKRTDSSRACRPANCCGVKQKHSVLWKYCVACSGAMLGTACAVTGCSRRLRA